MHDESMVERVQVTQNESLDEVTFVSAYYHFLERDAIIQGAEKGIPGYDDRFFWLRD